jgi:hypothetical protein
MFRLKKTFLCVRFKTSFGTIPGLPDGLFSNQKSQFGQSLEGLGLENVDIFYGHVDYYPDIWDIL